MLPIWYRMVRRQSGSTSSQNLVKIMTVVGAPSYMSSSKRSDRTEDRRLATRRGEKLL